MLDASPRAPGATIERSVSGGASVSARGSTMAGTARTPNRLRVLDLTTGIAGGYCGKLLVDAGADVVKVEPVEGDPLRRRGSGSLFAFLNGGKRYGDTVVDADVVLTNDPGDVVRFS